MPNDASTNPYLKQKWIHSTGRRLTWIFRFLLLGMTAQILLSLSLWWATDGVLPYLPLIATSGGWLEKSSIILFPVFLLLILINWIRKDRDLFLKLLLVCGLLLVIGNLHRVQVWFYFYGLMLFLFINRKKVTVESIALVARLVVIGVYCWSGIHKWNIHFAEDIFPWLLEPLGFTNADFPTETAYLTGGAEVLMGIGLLCQSTRNLTVLICLIFHLVILFLLGPLGHNWNPVVWPWNVTMPVLVFLLFYKTNRLKSSKVSQILRSFPAGLLVLILVWIFPAFNYLNITPEQLSFKMYAGSQPEMVLYFGEKDKELLENHDTTYGTISPGVSSVYRVVLDDVAFAEWGTPMFTTPWTGKRILQQFCKRMESPEEGGLLYLVDDEFVEMVCLEGDCQRH